MQPCHDPVCAVSPPISQSVSQSVRGVQPGKQARLGAVGRCHAPHQVGADAGGDGEDDGNAVGRCAGGREPSVGRPGRKHQ